MLGENPTPYSVDDDSRVRDPVSGSLHGSRGLGATAAMATTGLGESSTAAAHTIDADPDATNTDQPEVLTSAPNGKRWWMLAAASAILLTGLTVAGIYLVTKKPSTVDQLVILTVPSGADIKLDAKEYGHSPVKLERLAIGTYTVTISKDGYESIVEPLPVYESGAPVEYKLKPIPPADTIGLPAEEQIRTFQQRAEEAFARGYYGMVYQESALYWADNIGRLDPNSAYSLEMRERIRKAAHQSAQSSIARGDLAHAQDVYKFLVDNYPLDEEALTAAAKLENQLARALGQVRDLVRKADEALLAGRLTEPSGKSAYFYSKQALAIDRQNEKARQIRNQVKEALTASGEQALKRGEIEAAIKQLEDIAQLFPEDRQSRARVREIRANRVTEAAKVPDTDSRRLNGLKAYRAGNFDAAIPDLQHAVVNGRSAPEVVFALARSYLKIGQLDHAEDYFRQLKPSRDDEYRSAVALLGDVAFQKGDSESAVKRWKEAKQLGGSTLYSVAALDDKIEQFEKKQREKAAEPTPLTMQVKHAHGGLLGGSCTGTLTINPTGVRYDAGQHVFASNLVGAGVSFTKDEMSIKFQGNSQKFRVPRADAERVRETLARYQQTYSPASK